MLRDMGVVVPRVRMGKTPTVWAPTARYETAAHHADIPDTERDDSLTPTVWRNPTVLARSAFSPALSTSVTGVTPEHV
ncbi:hypothetical protein GCM10010344_19850 [Streptomyces bluensis]|nr:hypothetical protein GCM10010344_19850 [Streptomyces bluensis]